MNKKKKLARLTVTALFTALIIVMTVTPYFGYIQYGGVIEITTIHIAVIFAACVLGPAKGAFIGGVWGVSCLLRAFTNTALYGLFLNPLISVAPRIIVGLVAGLIFKAFSRHNAKKVISLTVTAAAGTLTNTVLVLSAISVFGGTLNTYGDLLELVKSVFAVILSLNGGLELAAAVIIVPILYINTEKFFIKKIN